MLSSTEMASFIAEKFADGEFHSTSEAKATVAMLLSESDLRQKETNRRTGETTGKLKWEHEFHSALSRLKMRGKLERGPWGQFRIIASVGGHCSTRAEPTGSPSDDVVALLGEVSTLAARVGGPDRLKQIIDMMKLPSARSNGANQNGLA